MDYQYRENGARNIYSNYSQMRAYVKCSSNQSKKIMPYRPIHRAIDETLKRSEKCWPFLCLNSPEYNFAVQLYQPTFIRHLPLLYVYKETTVSVILGLSLRVGRQGDFVTRFFQPSTVCLLDFGRVLFQ